jgi:putative glutamine amidotransferase
MNRPRIGITLDSEPAGGWSKMPWYALRQNYCGAVADVGGLPLPLPHEPELASAYLDGLDGLLVTGGAFDVDPALFGDGTKHATVKTKDRRTAFEYAMVKGAIERDMPILGICGGEQLLTSCSTARCTSTCPTCSRTASRTSSPTRAPNPATRSTWCPARCCTAWWAPRA